MARQTDRDIRLREPGLAGALLKRLIQVAGFRTKRFDKIYVALSVPLILGQRGLHASERTARVRRICEADALPHPAEYPVGVSLWRGVCALWSAPGSSELPSVVVRGRGGHCLSATWSGGVSATFPPTGFPAARRPADP